MPFLEAYALLAAVGLFAAMLALTEVGHRVGTRRRANAGDDATGIGTIEGALFALLGLLIAFTFQGAASRFDERRALIVEEANIIGTAWLRIDLLPESVQPGMRAMFRDYLDSRLETYRRIPDLEAVKAERARSLALQGAIWRTAIEARASLAAPEAQAIVVGVLPLLNDMFDIVTTRTMAVETHPPGIVFVMLAGMALASSFLAGHGLSSGVRRSWVHSLGFALILSGTVYVILDMEYPRLGFIRVDAFDHVLVEVRESMNE